MSARIAAPEEVIERIIGTRMIAILRGFTPEEALRAGRALADGGARVLEVSLVDPQALRSIEGLREELGGECVVGAGTVITESAAEAPLEAAPGFLSRARRKPGRVAAAAWAGGVAVPGGGTASRVSPAGAGAAPLRKRGPGRPPRPVCL